MIDMNQIRMRTRLAFVFAAIWIVGTSLLVFSLYQIMAHYIHKEVQNRLGNYVAHAAMLINPEEHARLQSPEDEKGAIYAHLVKQLRDFRNQSTDIRFVYTARLNSEGKVVFIVDAEESEEKSALGSIYEEATPLMQRAAKMCTGPLVEEHYDTDEWGTFISAYAPILTKDGRQEGIVGIDLSLSAGQKTMRTILAWAIGISLSLTFLIILFTFHIGRRLAVPIESACEELNRISKGDLSIEISEEFLKNGDEIGNVFRAMRTMNNSLRHLLNGILNSVQTLVSSATKLSATSNQIASNTQEMSSQTATAAIATEQANINIQTISSSAKEISNSANSVVSTIGETNASLDEVAGICRKEVQIVAKVNNHVHTGKEIMDQLGLAAKSIGKVIEVINDIADQINLLALNATIEAASAGDAGKSFAVVANEIKELARQTAQATQEIEKQIEEMQNNSDSAVKAMDLIAKIIEDVNSTSQAIMNAIEKQRLTANAITKNVGIVSEGIKEVAQNVVESAKGISEVATTINRVNNAVKDTSLGIGLVNVSAGELAKLSECLKELMRQFKM